MNAKPVIAITLDVEPPGGYSKFPWYAVRKNHCDVISDAGGIPVCVPHHPELVENYMDMADGFIITGGGFDIDPSLYGVNQRHETIKTKPGRTAFEWAFLKEAHARQKPILGICGGMQLLNAVLGGTLIQHIPDEMDKGLAHKQLNSASEAGHDIRILKETLLDRIAQEVSIYETVAVNSVHHQAVKNLAPGLRINAIAEDGIIEGIEDSSQPFCLGVQWHPEFYVNPLDRQIFKQFVQACSL